MEGKQLRTKTRRTMLVALTFSLIGDILLMFDNVSSNYFLTGLASFLIAHFMYIMVFLEKRNNLLKPIPFIALLLVYALGFLYLLFDGLGYMFLPVVIYVLAILTMAITASLRKGNVPTISYNLVLVGAILFVISDSFIAINKFYSALPNEHVMIMSTYALAQYCIVMGIIKQKN